MDSDPIIGAKWGDCKHYQGIQAGECAVGVKLRTLVGGADDGWCTRLPCLGSFRGRANGPTVMCDLFVLPTAAEIAEEEAETAAMIAEAEARFRILDPVCEKIKAESRGKDAHGTTTCPACEGELHWRHAAYNGHVWLKCATDDCVAIIE